MSLPYLTPDNIKVFPNEYLNSVTLNRSLLRLYYNDLYLSTLSSLNAINTPTVESQMLVSTSAGVYEWKTAAEIQALLSLADNIFDLNYVDINQALLEDGYGLAWDSTKTAFVSKKIVEELNDLSDVTTASPQNLQSLMYSNEVGKFINAYPDNFAVGYVTNITVQADTKVLLPTIDGSGGEQIVITKYGTGTSVYIIPNGSQKIEGETGKVLKSYNTNETTSVIQLRSMLKTDLTTEWIIVGGTGTWDFITSGTVPGGLTTRTVTSTELMLQPYSVTYQGVTNVYPLPTIPEVNKIYFLTTSYSVYPKGTYMYDGSGWKCISQQSDIVLTSWAGTAINLTLVAGVVYTVTATAEPTSIAIDLQTSGDVIILKTGAFAIPEPTSGTKLTDTGLDALTETTNDVQIIVEKIGTEIIYSAAEVIALS